jgi:hypothetical protein
LHYHAGASTRPNLNVVANYGPANMWDSQISKILIPIKAETFTAYDTVCSYRYVLSEFHVWVDYR